jgi:predicted enzyme related to lactoylglutathione lyase
VVAGNLVHFELPAQDTDRAQKFYEEVFGWRFRAAYGPVDYRMTEENVQPVGAIYPSQEGERGPIVYFDTDDIDATAAQIRERGGQADEKAPIPGIGWFARAQDPEGNSISLFQADESVPAPGEH